MKKNLMNSMNSMNSLEAFGSKRNSMNSIKSINSSEAFGSKRNSMNSLEPNASDELESRLFSVLSNFSKKHDILSNYSKLNLNDKYLVYLNLHKKFPELFDENGILIEAVLSKKEIEEFKKKYNIHLFDLDKKSWKTSQEAISFLKKIKNKFI